MGIARENAENILHFEHLHYALTARMYVYYRNRFINFHEIHLTNVRSTFAIVFYHWQCIHRKCMRAYKCIQCNS